MGTCDLSYYWRGLSVLYPSPTQALPTLYSPAPVLPTSNTPTSSPAEADFEFMQDFRELCCRYKQFKSEEEMEDFLSVDQGMGGGIEKTCEKLYFAAKILKKRRLYVGLMSLSNPVSPNEH
jgi:hypothetical protein